MQLDKLEQSYFKTLWIKEKEPANLLRQEGEGCREANREWFGERQDIDLGWISKVE